MKVMKGFRGSRELPYGTIDTEVSLLASLDHGNLSIGILGVWTSKAEQAENRTDSHYRFGSDGRPVAFRWGKPPPVTKPELQSAS